MKESNSTKSQHKCHKENAAVEAWYLGLKYAPICLAAHPSQPSLLSGFSEGEVVLNVFSSACGAEGPQKKHTEHYDTGSSCVQTSFQGSEVFVVANSEGKLLTFDVSRTTALETKLLPTDEEGTPRTATAFRALAESSFLVGDDCGGLHLFDTRTSQGEAVGGIQSCKGLTCSILEQADYISAIAPVSAYDKDAFLVTSGDGTLCAYDLRFPPKPKLKLQYAFDSFQEDLLSLAVLPKHSLAVSGTLTGPLNLYNLRFMDDSFDPSSAAHVDRFYGHPEAVNVVMPWDEDEDIIISASSDGIIRVIDVPSRKLVGVLDYPVHVEQSRTDSLGSLRKRKKKKKRKEERWPVEDMVKLRGLDLPLFALLGHGSGIQFCDGSSLVEETLTVHHESESKSGQAEVKQMDQDEIEREAETSSSFRKKKRRRKGFDENEKKVDQPSFFEGL
ncbi:WD40/YVTN repeat-like containing protein [Gracilaria domingensis]|nr:WD40/YVTN repeat-like containing protein [Gracilaria domingensis]